MKNDWKSLAAKGLAEQKKDTDTAIRSGLAISASSALGKVWELFLDQKIPGDDVISYGAVILSLGFLARAELKFHLLNKFAEIDNLDDHDCYKMYLHASNLQKAPARQQYIALAKDYLGYD